MLIFKYLQKSFLLKNNIFKNIYKNKFVLINSFLVKNLLILYVQ